VSTFFLFLSFPLVFGKASSLGYDLSSGRTMEGKIRPPLGNLEFFRCHDVPEDFIVVCAMGNRSLFNYSVEKSLLCFLPPVPANPVIAAFIRFAGIVELERPP